MSFPLIWHGKTAGSGEIGLTGLDRQRERKRVSDASKGQQKQKTSQTPESDERKDNGLA